MGSIVNLSKSSNAKFLKLSNRYISSGGAGRLLTLPLTATKVAGRGSQSEERTWGCEDGTPLVLSAGTTYSLYFGRAVVPTYEALFTVNPELHGVAEIMAPSLIPVTTTGEGVGLYITVKVFGKDIAASDVAYWCALYLID